MSLQIFGCITTPMQGNQIPSDAYWIADNGCFGNGYPGDTIWFEWLRTRIANKSLCHFATAPDVVGDAKATLLRSLPWLDKIRDIGYQAAFVAQDGLENLSISWDAFDVIFIGGSTEWKLSSHAKDICHEAKSRGKKVHVGRVNSNRRLNLVTDKFMADTADGTYLIYGPVTNLPKLLDWDQIAYRMKTLGITWKINRTTWKIDYHKVPIAVQPDVIE